MSLEQDLKRLRDERQQKFNEEDWEGALEIHDKILELSPSPLRYANRGSILYRLGRIEEAIGAYRKALELDPSLKRAKADLERLEGQLQEQQQKETNLPLPDQSNNIPQSQQDKLNELRDQRQACLQNEDWEGALQKHDEILAIEPTALRYANKGSILYRLRRLPEAAESYRKALELDPSMEPAKHDLERLEAQMEEEGLLGGGGGKQNEKEVYEKIELLRKQRQEKVEQGLWDDALAIHDQVLALEPTALRHANRGALLYRLGKHREAIASYQTALGLDDSLEQAKEAITHLEGLLEEESLLAGSENEGDISQEELARKIAEYRDERQIFIKEKNWQKALEMHDKIIELEPTALRYVNRGAMLYRMKNLQEAIDAHKKALEMDPSLENAKKDIARMEKELEKKRNAQEETITPLVDKNEPDPKEIEEKLEQLKSRRQEQIELNNWEKALQYQNEIIQLEPNALRYTNKGSMLYRLGKVNEAILCYRKALELDPELERATSDLERLKENEMDRLREERQIQMEEENWGQALYLHDIILALETTALRMANRGSILYRMNRFQEAMESYRKALDLDPNLEKAKEDIARLQEEINQPQELSAIPEEFEEVEEDDQEFFNAVPVDEADEMDAVDELSVEEEVLSSLPVSVLEGHKGEITDIHMVPNTSTLISASKDKTIKIWDINTNECIRTLEGHDDWVRFLTLSPDGTRLFSCSDDWNVRAWNFDTGQCEYILEGHTMPVLHVSTSPSHRFLFSTSRDRTIKIWDYQNGKLLSTLEGHEDWVNYFIPTPDGNKAISSSLDGDIRIWNVLGWRCTNTLKGHQGWVEFLYLTQDGSKIVSGSSDNTIKVWNFAEGTEEKSISTNTALTDMILTKDGKKVITATKDNTIRIWDLNSGECSKIIRDQNSITAKLALINNDEHIVSSSLKGDISIWCMASGAKVAQFDDNTVTNKFTIIPDKNLVLGACRDATIKIWNTEKC